MLVTMGMRPVTDLYLLGAMLQPVVQMLAKNPLITLVALLLLLLLLRYQRFLVPKMVPAMVI